MIGQVLWLKIYFTNDHKTPSSTRHPYLIASICADEIEVIQLDSLYGKEHEAMRKHNKVIYVSSPRETVISKDSYACKNMKITLENKSELVRFRSTEDTLSIGKLSDVLSSYRQYQENNDIPRQRRVHMTIEEINGLNS